MGEPKYDEDTVNLGYLKKVISETSDEIEVKYKEVSRHYGTKPTPPYYKGDTWIDGDIVYTCINSRQIGLYEDSDWTTESGAKKEAEEKSKVFLTKPYNYRPGDMWILQSDDDHKAGKKGEMLISNAGRKDYNEDDWINMLGYGSIISINEVADNLNNAINRIGNVEDAIEDGIIVTFYQNSIPDAKHLGDLWYVTDNVEDYIKGKLYRYDGTDWDLLDDPDIQKAFEEANEARIVADGKIQSFYSNTEPTKDIGVGDLWIDTSNDNKLYRYNGTNWVAVYDTRIDNLIVTTNTTSERVAEIQTDLVNITSKVSTIEEQVTTTTGDIERIDKTITENTAKQEIKDNQILQTVTNQVTTAKQEAIDSANSSTDEKLQNYSTTSQIESKISQKADEFDVKLEKKVDNDTLTGAELALRINNGGSSAKLNSDRITLSANDILNLLAGNTINLTAKNIGLYSDILTILPDGKMTFKSSEDSVGLIRLINYNETVETFLNYRGILLRNEETGNSVLLRNMPNGTWLQMTSANGKQINILNNDDFSTISFLENGEEKTKIRTNEITTPKVYVENNQHTYSAEILPRIIKVNNLEAIVAETDSSKLFFRNKWKRNRKDY